MNSDLLNSPRKIILKIFHIAQSDIAKTYVETNGIVWFYTSKLALRCGKNLNTLHGYLNVGIFLPVFPLEFEDTNTFNLWGKHL